MADLVPSPTWDNVRSLETTDPNHADVFNAQAQQVTNRTEFLNGKFGDYYTKPEVDAAIAAIDLPEGVDISGKYDKTGGTISGNVSILGTLSATGTANIDGNLTTALVTATGVDVGNGNLSGAQVNLENGVELTSFYTATDRAVLNTTGDYFEFNKPIHAPSFVGGNVSIAENGYTSLPNGLIMQWGTYDTIEDLEQGVTIAFPTAFTSQCLNVQATRKMVAHGTQGDGEVHFISATTTQASFSLNHDADGSSALRGFTWLAIGY